MIRNEIQVAEPTQDDFTKCITASMLPELTSEQKTALDRQDSRLVSTFRAKKFDDESKKHWDIFYKRNENRFFKDRHWTTREFWELCLKPEEKSVKSKSVLVEIGCGVGNFAFPLLQDKNCELFIYACDFSPRAIEFVKSHDAYDEEKIAPACFENAIQNAAMLLKKGSGLLLFRDYAVNDMAMFRFGPNSKVVTRRYVRQDGTMTYFFEKEEIQLLMNKCGLEMLTLELVERRTINKKEGLDVPRLFIQGKFRKI